MTTKLPVLILAAVDLMVLAGCGKYQFRYGKASVSVDTSIFPAAEADVSSCLGGMHLIPATTGFSSFCIDDTPSGTVIPKTHLNATYECSLAGKALCSSIQWHRACAEGDINPSYNYYVREIVALPAPGGLGHQGGGCTPNIWTGTAAIQYYCCTE